MILHTVAILWAVSALAAADIEVYPGGEMCPNWEAANGARQAYVRAIAAEQAGDPEKAFGILKNNEGACFRQGPSADTFYQSYIRLARMVATRAEANGNFDTAIAALYDIRQAMYERYVSQFQLVSEIGRLRMASARAKPADFKLQSGVEAEFSGAGISTLLSQYGTDSEHAARMQVVDGYLQELRANAQTQGDRLLDEEQTAFSARPVGATDGTLPLLERARAWMQLARSERTAAVTRRAIDRGDSLAALDAPHRLELAQDYYRFADSASHLARVQARAKKLGDSANARAHYESASEYYQIAGLEDLAAEVLEHGEAENEAAEENRRERFQQEQDDLERELDF